METRIGMVKVTQDAKEKLARVLEMVKEKPEDARAQMKINGYYWDSLHIVEREGENYLVYVCKSPDWDKIKVGHEGDMETDWYGEYKKFQNECWLDGINSMRPFQDMLGCDLKS